MCTAWKSAATRAACTSQGNSAVSSISAARGAILSVASWRTASRRSSCSSEVVNPVTVTPPLQVGSRSVADTWSGRNAGSPGYADAVTHRVSVIGTGYLGATHAACMVPLGHEVIGIDTDAEKVKRLAEGDLPFYEPGLPDLLQRSLATGRLTFTTDPAE